MAVFMVVNLIPNAPMTGALAAAYPETGAYLQLSPTAWLVSDSGGVTTKDVCDKIGIKLGPEGISQTIAVKVESYYGVASPNVWEWLKVKIAE